MRLLITLSVIALTLTGYGQRSEKKARHYFDHYSYSTVIELLKDKKSLSLDAQRMLAQSYLMMANYKAANKVYARIVKDPATHPDDLYAYVQVLRMNGQYLQAGQQMQRYALLRPKENRVRLFNRNPSYVDTLLRNKGQFLVRNLDFNTAQEDFGLVYYKGKVVFTSSRIEDKAESEDYWGGNMLPYLNLYTGEIGDRAEIVKIEKLDHFNSRLHSGSISYSKNGQLAFYTSNGSLGLATRVVNLGLYEARRVDGNWQESIPFSWNNKDYSLGHPALSADGKTLYFSSDMPGGKGGLDLYSSSLQPDGSWSRPLNLGDTINTEGNEMFPSVLENGLFFFASDGHPGLGGMDVFATELKNGQPCEVINVGAPLNSSKDDFSLVLDSTFRRGYFASNREGGKGDDDLYSVELVWPFAFSKPVIKEVVVEKKKEPEPQEQLNIPAIYFDFGKYALRVEAKLELDKVVAIMNAHPTMIIELRAYTDCRGTTAANQVLSEKRAEVSVEYIRKFISHPERIEGKGYGETYLKKGCTCEEAEKSGCPEAQYQMNRRIEFFIIRS